MKVLVFEWLYGGGLWITGEIPDPNCLFQTQGRKMLSCFAQDLTSAGFEVRTLRDVRVNKIETCCVEKVVTQEPLVRGGLEELAEEVDYIVLIAPECDWCLLNCCRWLDPWAAKIASPDARFIELTSDKNKTAAWLSERGVAVARGAESLGWHEESTRAVIKPALGAGSERIRIVEDWSMIEPLIEPANWRIEEFVAGRSASVSVLCGNAEKLFLTPTWQILDGELGVYVASVRIECEIVRTQALETARRTAEALPETRGYVGIDMVIGESPHVVDVNPRLTTSYCYLREIEHFNIAAAMLESCQNSGTAQTMN